MLTQDFLQAGGTIQELEKRYAIKAVRSTRHPSLILLKYNQLDSPMGEQIPQECRGLILDESKDWRVVSQSFRKFFNEGEGHAAEIDWATAKVQEKLDGSLCVIYHHMGAWHVQTSGHPDAAGKVGGEEFIFADLFWHTFHEHRWLLPNNTDLCVSFELMTKWNRVVVVHEKPTLRMIGVRNRRTGKELPLDVLGHLYTPVREFPLQSLTDIRATFAHMEPLKQEGYVVVDGQFNRIKVKHPGYVAIHHLRDGCSRRRLVEIVQAGEVGEFLAYFPEWAQEFNAIQTGLTQLEAELVADYARIQPACPVQKDFAHYALKTRCSAALFLLRAGKIATIGEYLRRMPPDHLLQMLGLKDKEM